MIAPLTAARRGRWVGKGEDGEMRERKLIGPLGWRIEWKPQDLWVGIFWRKNESIGGDMAHDIWVCVIPMLPLHLRWHL